MSAYYYQQAPYAQPSYPHGYYGVPVIAQPQVRQNYLQHSLLPPTSAPTILTRRCNECNRGFAGSAELELHQNSGNAIQCNVCGMYCSCWDMLALHQTSRHSHSHSHSSAMSPGPDSPASPMSPGA